MNLTLADTGTPTGLISVDGRTFPLRATRITGRARAGIAATTLVQEYANPHAEPLEVVYTMPLPAEAAVVGYTFRLGERIVRGQIRRRADAREAYQRALEQGRTAGLLEQQRADTFSQRLGSLPPGAAVRVEIELLQPLRFESPAGSAGEPVWEYRFPTVTGVRYHGGRVEDAGALEPPRADAQGTPARLEVELLLEDGGAEHTRPCSPSHEIRVASEEGTTRVDLAGSARLDRDLVLRYAATRAAVGIALTEGPGLPGDSGRYGMLTLTPPAAEAGVFARDLTLLLDASGSMSGEPIQQAVAVVEELLAGLRTSDRFEILAFSNSVRELIRGPLEATPKNVQAALRELRGLRAGGGTEMASALLHALTPLREGSQRQVVLVTDGQIGFEQEVVRGVLEKLPCAARLHVVAIGAAPNRNLTRSASRAGRGVELLVSPGEDARLAAARLAKACVAPILTDLVLHGSALVGAAPERPGDVFAERPLLTAVELRPEGGTLEVEGRLAGSAGSFRRTIVVGARAEQPSTLPLGALYGRERVEDAEMHLAATQPLLRPLIEEQIATLALRHRIVSRATSLVAVSEEPGVDPGNPRRREEIVAEIPSGVSAEMVGYAGPGFERFPRGEFLGRAALQGSCLEEPLQHIAEPEIMQHLIEQVGSMRAKRLTEGLTGSSVPPVGGRIVTIEADVLVIETEVPPTGLELPADGDRITLRLASGEVLEARLIGARSTRPGSHAPGLTVRIALRIEGGRTLRDPKLLEWTIGARQFGIVLPGTQHAPENPRT